MTNDVNPLIYHPGGICAARMINEQKLVLFFKYE